MKKGGHNSLLGIIEYCAKSVMKASKLEILEYKGFYSTGSYQQKRKTYAKEVSAFIVALKFKV